MKKNYGLINIIIINYYCYQSDIQWKNNSNEKLDENFSVSTITLNRIF
jgi:hypothetical protein